MSFPELFKLQTNPFRVLPAINPEDIIWAGFEDIKKKFEQKISRAIKIPNSALILNWGEYGSGKTHAARYFHKHDVLTNLAGSNPIPFSLIFVLPKGKNPVYDIFTIIIDKVDFLKIRESFRDLHEDIIKYIKKVTDNMHIQNVLNAVFSELDVNILKKYLYGNITPSELRDLNSYNILRNFNEGDYTKFLAGLFSCLTFEKKVFSNVIIWIDEFEDIATYNIVNVDKTNHFIRELLDNTPNNLLIFINLTQTALFSLEDLGQYINGAVSSRIKDRINFEIPSETQVLEYLNELLNHPKFRTEAVENKYFPFEEEVLKEILKNLNNPSLRRINDALSLLLEIAELDACSPITKSYFEENKTEIIGWKE